MRKSAFLRGTLAVPFERVSDHIADIASANWHASARFAARELGNGLFVDMGSTTTDLVALADGKVDARGYTDAQRLEAGELVYTGMVRSFLMSVASRVPFQGRSMPLMNEYFANMADVYRILGDLPAGADQQATADGREKTVAASRARLARMLGLDAAEASKEAWIEVARAFREAQLRTLHDAAMLVLSRRPLPPDAPIIGAGIGVKIAGALAARLQRPFVPFSRFSSRLHRGFASLHAIAPPRSPWLCWQGRNLSLGDAPSPVRRIGGDGPEPCGRAPSVPFERPLPKLCASFRRISGFDLVHEP